MITISKTELYSSGVYSYKNFTNLSIEEKLMVLDWRNHESVRKWMVTSEPIRPASHLDFVDSLKNRDDSYYWLVFLNHEPIGVVSLSKVSLANSSCESGFYLNPKRINNGEGFDFTLSFLKLMFIVFNIECLHGIVMKQNRFAIISALFFGTRIVKECFCEGKDYYITLLSKADFLSDLEIKSDIKQFAKFVYSTKKASTSDFAEEK